MKSALWVAVVAACGPGLRQEPRTTPDDSAAGFVAATQSGDVAAVRRMLGPSVTLGGLWFPDPTCAREFVITGDVGGGRLDELARCLTTVKFELASRKDPLPDAAILRYAPGIEVEAVFTERREGPWLSWIGYEARRSVADALPTISPETLESLRIAGQRDPAVDGLDAEIQRAQAHYSKAWIKLCLDADGNVTGAHVREASSNRAARTFTAALADWKFKPFAPDGHAIPVCSLVLLAKPLELALAHESIPFPLSERSDVGLIVPIQALHRIHGETAITPDDRSKVWLHKGGTRRLIGSYQLCLDAGGHVTDVRMLKSTGLADYDAKIIRNVKQWEYEPYLDEGTAIPVCSAVTFIYHQR